MRMNSMRERHFRRHCAQRTLSVSPNCRPWERFVNAGLFDRGVRGAPAFFRVRSLGMETVTPLPRAKPSRGPTATVSLIPAFLLIVLGGCKEERPAAETPAPVRVQRIAVETSAEARAYTGVVR